MSLASEEKPTVSGLANSGSPTYTLLHTIQARSRPSASGHFPRISNPQISETSSDEPFLYRKHALCIRCRRILQISRILEPKTQRAAELELGCNLWELLGCAAQGCHFCSILISSLEGPCWRGGGTVKDVERITISISSSNSRSLIETAASMVNTVGQLISNPSTILDRVLSYEEPKIQYIISVEIDSDSDSRTSWDSISALVESRSGIRKSSSYTRSAPLDPVDPVGETTGTDDAFYIARWWLKYCLERHASCSTQLTNSHVPPTRLLEICDIGMAKHVRLSSSAHQQKPILYLTLSHCWGKTQLLKLTAGNCSDLHVKVPWHLLSKTFQDAIEITHRLGYEYLWIDSLCIMQDSKSDWERESLRMGSYYGNAVCTIAALSSKDGTGGCYKSRNPLRMQECIIKSSNGRCLRLQAERPMYYEFDTTIAPLHERAWVVQERLLSPRTLYYGSTGIYWECRTSCAAEWDLKHIAVNFQGKGAKSDIEQRPIMASLKSLYWELQTCPDTAERRRHFLSIWYKIVQTYTRSHFTFPTDKLVALTGVVDTLQERLNISFYAGLWSTSRAIDLVWEVDITKVRNEGYTKLAEERLPIEVPTWSWISSPYPIEHPCQIFWRDENTPSQHYTFVDLVHVKVGSEDPLEAATRSRSGMYCELTMEHPLFKCKVVHRDLKEFTPAGLFLENGDSLSSLTCDTLHLKGSNMVWCALILKMVGYGDVYRHPWSHTYYGIALQPNSLEANTWNRVGSFSFDSSEFTAIRDQIANSSDPTYSRRTIVLI